MKKPRMPRTGREEEEKARPGRPGRLLYRIMPFGRNLEAVPDGKL
jgi:hypothetical protein